MLKGTAQAREIARDLGCAIANNQLQVHYQPIVDLATGSIREVEALVRWEHPRWGAVSPSVFIPIAEQNHLILDLGRWVLETACRQAVEWQQQFPDRPPLTMNVNLSVRQVRQPGLADIVRQTLDETGLAAERLHLEITEGLLVKDGPTSLATFRALRKLGVTIAIDDFGTGYSSLSYLNWMPANVLKLDRTFIRRLGQDTRDLAIVRGIIAIAKDLGLTVIGEGVETAGQRDHLRALGCDKGQGYYFARPMAAQDLTALLNDEQPVIADRSAGAIGGARPPEHRAEHHDVLVIDDDDHIRRLASLALELEGYQVATAPHGTAALEQIKRQAPGIILLDMWMPVMDGWAFSQAYRAMPGPHAPIVVLTANPSPASCASQIGATAYLTKPFELDELLAKVGSLSASPQP